MKKNNVMPVPDSSAVNLKPEQIVADDERAPLGEIYFPDSC